MVSAKAAEEAKVDAFEAGADDYLTKPFGIRELVARVRAVLRRTSVDSEAAPLEIGDFRIDFAGRRVYVRGVEVRLTPKEFDLFLYLARRPNRVIGHRQLLGAVWGEASQEHPEYPEGLRRPASEEARSPAVDASLSRNRTLGWISVQRMWLSSTRAPLTSHLRIRKPRLITA